MNPHSPRQMTQRLSIIENRWGLLPRANFTFKFFEVTLDFFNIFCNTSEEIEKIEEENNDKKTGNAGECNCCCTHMDPFLDVGILYVPLISELWNLFSLRSL